MEPKRVGTRNQVYAVLRGRILALTLLPGAPISENELAAELDVSRTPVREGLLLLAQEGLVQVFPKIGSFVSRVDFDRVRDAQFIREAVEVASLAELAGSAAPAAPDEPTDNSGQLAPALVAELTDNLAQQRDAVQRTEEFFRLDEQFHDTLLRLAGHQHVWPAIASIKGHLDRARRLGLWEHASAEPFLDQHTEILEAVLAGNVEHSIVAMRRHLRLVLDDLEHAREHHPELFAGSADEVPRRRLVATWD